MPADLAIRSPIKIAYLTTTFPKLTETFLQREVRALRHLPVELEIFTLWGGGERFEGMTINRFPKAQLVTMLWLLPYWAARRPKAFVGLLGDLVARPVRSWKNFGETVVGICFALTHAGAMSRVDRRPDLIHAAWATMPATAAQLLAALTGIPFTMGAHAYDLYQNGGDWLLPGKLEEAALVVTSTEMARDELLSRGANPEKLMVVRRGIYPLPEFHAPRTRRNPLRILSVARLVEKKGIFAQLDIYAELRRRNIDFEARLVGDGPLEKAARARADGLGLSAQVRFLGSLAFADVLEQYGWADVFLFTGTIAKDGDRDGLPNVILEAMATGTPVVATGTGATTEIIRDGHNGVLISDAGAEDWIRALVRLRDDDLHFRRLSREGRLTVEDQGDAMLNARAFFMGLASVSGR